ncbi:MAG: dTDP-4-dehydrorhamnose reductase [Candidatus Omnitrophica bacterium]|nr:dTDP-4-dehydrorhamnose reductase [Candidatus Omnitrophota bacterium]
MKILLTGASGMLAAAVIPVLERAGHRVVKTDRYPRLPGTSEMDITDLEGVCRNIERESPGYVFHLAAETDVDLCEKDPDHAFEVNARGTENVARAAREAGAKFLYVSTGSVFNGEKDEPYTELDRPDPVSIYGRSKLEGESIVQGLFSEYFILRTAWLIGGWQIDKKFVYKIVQKILKGEKHLVAVSDRFGSPTFTRDFAGNLLNVIDTGKYGIYHMTNRGSCSRYEMATRIVEYMGRKNEVEVKPVPFEDFPHLAPRGRSQVLANHMLDKLGLNNMPYWYRSLEIYISENIK